MNAAINPPSHRSSQDGYEAECLFAMEPSIETLIDAAVDAGWRREAIALAMVTIAAGLADGEEPATRWS
jgi:hypothetical protein